LDSVGNRHASHLENDFGDGHVDESQGVKGKAPSHVRAWTEEEDAACDVVCSTPEKK
jgi:hypothetical protein